MGQVLRLIGKVLFSRHCGPLYMRAWVWFAVAVGFLVGPVAYRYGFTDSGVHEKFSSHFASQFDTVMAPFWAFVIAWGFLGDTCYCRILSPRLGSRIPFRAAFNISWITIGMLVLAAFLLLS